MEIRNQVCSTEQAIELKNLGVKQKSFLYWYNRVLRDTPNNWGLYALDYVQSFGYEETFEDTYKALIKVKDQQVMYSAFTVAELGVMIPNNYLSERVRLSNGKLAYTVESKNKANVQFSDTEAKARAGILINGLKSGFILLDEVNKRLLKP